MEMKTCTLLTLGFLMSAGAGFSIDRPTGNTEAIQPPPLTPYPTQAGTLPATKPVRLGIIPGQVPAALVEQLELSGFPGILVTGIVPDSPADKAGLKKNDVIVKLGNTSLSGPQSVLEALVDQAPGDKISAVLYRKGKQETVELLLDEGNLTADEILAAQGNGTPRPNLTPFGTRPQTRPSLRQHLPHMGPGTRADQIQQLMDAFLQDSLVEDPRMDELMNRMNLTPRAMLLLKGLQQRVPQPSMPPMGKVAGGPQSVATTQMSDSNGTIVVSSNSQTGTTVHVTDAAGKVLYSGPYNTPEEKASVPESVRERLKNIETNFCF